MPKPIVDLDKKQLREHPCALERKHHLQENTYLEAYLGLDIILYYLIPPSIYIFIYLLWQIWQCLCKWDHIPRPVNAESIKAQSLNVCFHLSLKEDKIFLFTYLFPVIIWEKPCL